MCTERDRERTDQLNVTLRGKKKKKKHSTGHKTTSKGNSGTSFSAHRHTPLGGGDIYIIVQQIKKCRLSFWRKDISPLLICFFFFLSPLVFMCRSSWPEFVATQLVYVAI